MNTVERVKAICKERRIPISKLEKDLGFGNGYIGQLRKGVFPDDRLNQISLYLGVSTQYLSGAIEDEDIAILMALKVRDPDEFKIHLKYLVALYDYRKEKL